jgi:hypothetical protein
MASSILRILTPIGVLLLGITLMIVGSRASSSISLPTDTLCPVCLAAAPAVLDDLSNSSTEEEIMAALDKICALLPAGPNQAECQKIVLDIAAGLASGGGAILSKYSPNAVCSAFNICINECCQGPNHPEQIHIAISSDPTIVRVSWATLNPTKSIVEWTTVRPNNYANDWGYLEGTVNGTISTWNSGGWKGFMHNATMTGLQPDTL